jgi:hypothetical protein
MTKTASITFMGCAEERMPTHKAVALFRAARFLDEPCKLIANGKTNQFRDIARPDKLTSQEEVKAANRIFCWQTLAKIDELIEGAELFDDEKTDPCIQLGDYYIAPDFKMNVYRTKAERWLLLDGQGECVKENLITSQAIEDLLVLNYRRELKSKL